MYSKYFKRHQRGEETIVIKTDDCPETIEKLVQNIHRRLGTGLPNDWIYEEIRSAFYYFEEGNDEVNVQEDPYRSSLYKWFNNDFSDEMINEYLKEFDPEINDIWEVIGNGQWYTREVIYQEVYNFLDENPYEETIKE